jgi:hypothetical protein
MNKSEIIDNLDTFKKRLIGEVLEAYKTRGRSYGQDRFDTWRRKFAQFLDESLPGTKPSFSLIVATSACVFKLVRGWDKFITIVSALKCYIRCATTVRLQ